MAEMSPTEVVPKSGPEIHRAWGHGCHQTLQIDKVWAMDVTKPYEFIGLGAKIRS